MINEYVATIFDEINAKNTREVWMNDLEEVYNPEFYHLKGNDMACTFFFCYIKDKMI